MNQGVKRYRQISIFESFAINKRPKTTPMEESIDNQERKTGLSKDKSSEIPANVKTSEIPANVKTSETGSPPQNSFSSVKKQSRDICTTSNKQEQFNEVASTSKSIIDHLWMSEDTKIKNEIHPIALESAILNKKVDSSYGESEDNYTSSADLFPEKSPLEDESLPNSNNSAELFNDSQQEEFKESQSSFEEVESTVIGESSSDSDEPDEIIVLNRSPDCDMPLPKLEPSENHSIMFSPYIRPGDAPRPFPRQYRDKWDTDHVRMPCSPLNKYPVENAMGETVIGSRWDLICQSLLSDIGSSKDLERAIMKYNHQYIGKWNFLGLHAFMNEYWSEEERDHFFEVLLPAMINMALNLPSICTQSVPLLKKNKDHSVTLSQKQIGCLLLNAFFCTFPRRNPRYKQWNSEYASFPDINFNRLFYGTKDGVPRRNGEKLKCIFNYFRRIVSKEPTGTVTFHRQVISLQNLPNWSSSTRGIRTVVIKSNGLIESDGHGMLQVDFANKLIGGGVLGQGMVQEEIRFLICPELIVSRLFVECLEHNEAVIITGAEEYSKYSGYCNTFKWEGDVIDDIPRDSWGRRCTKIVAIDATSFRSPSYQFTFRSFKRELNKAYCGFYENTPPAHLPAIATGNWGCGAFKGSPDLKFLIQLMAASECGRSLLYITFHDKKLKKKLQEMYEFVNNKNLTVGDLWRLLIDYSSNLMDFSSEEQTDLYSFIYSQFSRKKDSRQENRNNNEFTVTKVRCE